MRKEIIKSEREVFIEECEICGDDIKGFSEDGLKYNMKLHKDKHKKKDKKK